MEEDDILAAKVYYQTFRDELLKEQKALIKKVSSDKYLTIQEKKRILNQLTFLVKDHVE